MYLPSGVVGETPCGGLPSILAVGSSRSQSRGGQLRNHLWTGFDVRGKTPLSSCPQSEPFSALFTTLVTGTKVGEPADPSGPVRGVGLGPGCFGGLSSAASLVPSSRLPSFLPSLEFRTLDGPGHESGVFRGPRRCQPFTPFSSTEPRLDRL